MTDMPHEEGIAMDKVRIKRIYLSISALILCLALSGTVSASLAQTQFGFPVIVQSGNTVSFSNDRAVSSDNEALSINFPLFDGLMSGPSPSAFANAAASGASFAPLIWQTSSFPGLGSMFSLKGFNLY